MAGIAVSAGYFNQPEKTSEIFIRNPFGDERGFERFRNLGLLDVLIENNKKVVPDIVNYTPNAVYQGEVILFKATKPDPIPSTASPETAEVLRRLQVIAGEKQGNDFSDYAPKLPIIEIPEIHGGLYVERLWI